MPMLRRLLFGAVLALLPALSIPALAQGPDIGIEVFDRELEPYGRWGDHYRWGTVWSPRVSRDWRPYTRGYWVYTEDHGWYWEAEEPWGWAPFHYGRWVLDGDEGWLWIPGTEWGPAWVAWRSSDAYVGWAPLPPEAYWGPGGSLVYDDAYYDNPRFVSAWSFARPHDMTSPGLYLVLAPHQQSYFIFRQTRPEFGYRRYDRGVFNGGYDIRRYEQRVGRPVPLVRLRGVDSPRNLQRQPGGPEISVYRPGVIRRPDDPRFRTPTGVAPDHRPPGPGAVPGSGRPQPVQPFSDRTPTEPRRPDQPAFGKGQPSQPPTAGFPPPQAKGGPPPPAGKAPPKKDEKKPPSDLK